MDDDDIVHVSIIIEFYLLFCLGVLPSLAPPEVVVGAPSPSPTSPIHCLGPAEGHHKGQSKPGCVRIPSASPSLVVAWACLSLSTG